MNADGPETPSPPAGNSFTATVSVPVARVPLIQLLGQTLPPVPLPSGMDTAALPDDPAVLKQMIADLLRVLRGERRDREEVQQRLDALLRRLYGPRPSATQPDQPLIFPDPTDDIPVSLPPIPSPGYNPPSRRGQCKPHGRRQLPPHLRREPRRYELTEAERRCPECGDLRGEIGSDMTEQYEYKPAEVYVVSHQRVKYACPCCEGHVAIAAKPPQPIEKGLPGPGLLAHIAMD